MKYTCSICGYVYDEEKEGMPFNDLPSNWVCPICGAPKDIFTANEEVKNVDVVKEKSSDIEVKPLIMAIICSNLAKGCEKQYDEKGKLLFQELSDYFLQKTKLIAEANLQMISNLINDDLAMFEPFDKIATKNDDRGTRRAYLWTNKVSNMVKVIIERYEKEGVNFLKDNKIYVCSICGFTYISKTPPEICPVCKVPNWKFIEGGI